MWTTLSLWIQIKGKWHPRLQLGKEFSMRDLALLKFFLGIQVEYFEEGIHLSQTQHLVNLLQSYDLDNLRSTPTPMVADIDLSSEEPPISDAREYRRIIGSLQYITLMRVDVRSSCS